jgi:uncharacterized protein YjbJ (UPF0337 family)
MTEIGASDLMAIHPSLRRDRLSFAMFVALHLASAASLSTEQLLHPKMLCGTVAACSMFDASLEVLSFRLQSERKMSGKSDEMKGRLKKAAGEITGNDELKREGTIDKAAGKVKQGVDKVKDALKGDKK